jgi:hypothetical protein
MPPRASATLLPPCLDAPPISPDSEGNHHWGDPCLRPRRSGAARCARVRDDRGRKSGAPVPAEAKRVSSPRRSWTNCVVNFGRLKHAPIGAPPSPEAMRIRDDLGRPPFEVLAATSAPNVLRHRDSSARPLRRRRGHDWICLELCDGPLPRIRGSKLILWSSARSRRQRAFTPLLAAAACQRKRRIVGRSLRA